MIKSKITAQVELITPEIAKEYLKLNIRNRGIRRAAVNGLARDIKNGNWWTTNEGVGFDEDGNLCDGQHRLEAIVAANEPVEVLVVRNIPREAVIAIDKGIKRTLNDNYRMIGNMPDAFDGGQLPSAIRAIVRNHFDINATDQDVIRIYESCPTRFDIVASVIQKKNRGCKVTRDFNAAIVSAYMCGEPIEALSSFVDTYANYENSYDYNIQAALNWRHQNDGIKRISPIAVYKGTMTAIYNYIHTDIRITRIPDKYKYDVRNMFIGFIQNR